MTPRLRTPLVATLLAGSLLISARTFAQVPAPIAASGETAVATFHAEGAQVYECKLDSSSRLVWQFREPIAALILDGKTVGRHYAGPNWQHVDGSAVRAKMVSSLPGATSDDVPWLKLDVTEQRGNGVLSRCTRPLKPSRRRWADERTAKLLRCGPFGWPPRRQANGGERSHHQRGQVTMKKIGPAEQDRFKCV